MSAHSNPMVSLRDVTKIYPGVVALQNLDLDIEEGTIHAIVGLNGAGKSTLVNLLAGVIKPDGGSIDFRSSIGSRPQAVSLVPQDIMMVPGLSVGRNILLGLETGFMVQHRLGTEELSMVMEALDRVGLRVHPETDPADCSVPQLRLAQIARALLAPGTVMLLDEPTAVLSEGDADRLLELIASLRDQGEAVVYVSHRLGEVLRLADLITVLRDGRKAASFARGEIDRTGLIDLLAKQRTTAARSVVAASPVSGAVVLGVENLSGVGFEGLNLSVRSGEVTALVGVQDAGHSQAVKALAGAKPSAAGTVKKDLVGLNLSSPATAVASGLVLVPAERRSAGVVGPMTVRENTVLSPRSTAKRFGWRLRKHERHTAAMYIAHLEIKTVSGAPVSTLSGGNQQKVAIAKALEARPDVLLLDEPTQGIDAATKGDVLQLIKSEARRSGRAVIAATSQLEEVPGWADTVIVFKLGKAVARLTGSEITEERLLQLSIS